MCKLATRTSVASALTTTTASTTRGTTEATVAEVTTVLGVSRRAVEHITEGHHCVGQLGSLDFGEEKPARGSTRHEATEACGSRNSRDPPQPRDKNHLTIDLSPRLIALRARSADSLATSLTAGKNVARFAPIGGAVDSASLVDPSDPRPGKGVALSRSSPKRVD